MLIASFSFLIACAVAWILTPLTGRLARRYGVIDHPSQDEGSHKRHAEPTPYLGGIAISTAVVIGSLSVFLAAEGIPVRHFVLTIGAGVGLGLVGLLDDIAPMPRSVRLAAQVVVALGAWRSGFGVGSAPYEVVNLALTILWIVGITNAFNLLDNMDGVSAGLAGIAALAFTAMGLMAGLPLLPIVAAALSGASFGFLIHNRHPAKVFMGDAGSLFIGFLVALLGLRLRFDNLPEVTFLVPVVALALPILDTTLVVVSRLRHRRPVFLGGRDHITHRLVLMGMSIPVAVRTMYVAAITLASLAVVISLSNEPTGLALVGMVLVSSVVAGTYLGKVPVYDEHAGPRSVLNLSESTDTGLDDPMMPEAIDGTRDQRSGSETAS